MTLINRTLLPQFIAEITGVPCKWLNNQRDYVSPTAQAAIYLQVTLLTQLGWDDQRNCFNTDTNMIDVYNVGMRPFTLSCRIESYEESPAAYEYADMVNIGLFQDFYKDQLRAVGMVFIDQGVYTDLPVIYDSRMISCCNVDLKMVALSHYATGSNNSRTYISTVGLVNDVEEP